MELQAILGNAATEAGAGEPTALSSAIATTEWCNDDISLVRYGLGRPARGGGNSSSGAGRKAYLLKLAFFNSTILQGWVSYF